MSNAFRTAVLLIGLSTFAACSSHEAGGMEYSARDGDRVTQDPPPTRAIDHPTGASENRAAGEVSGGMTTTPEPARKEPPRGNTPPGIDRDGHGPAAGAIVDPSGAATRPKPY